MATILRKCLLMAFAMLTTTGLFAQSNKQAINILDKTASIIGHKGGASADFTFQNAKVGTTSGSIAIKGNRFNATTPAATVWFDGKTQWTYMQKTQEVNITTPTQAQQMQMNPYTFTHIYKTGYTTTMTTSGQSYEIHLVAQNKKRTQTHNLNGREVSAVVGNQCQSYRGAHEIDCHHRHGDADNDLCCLVLLVTEAAPLCHFAVAAQLSVY